MNILVATDDVYYPRLKIFANTLQKQDHGNFEITIMHSRLSDSNIADFEAFAAKKGIRYRFAKIEETRFNNYKLLHQLTIEVYFRFLVLHLYPNASRVMWVDTDTVVRKSLQPFYHQDLEGNHICACSGNNEKKHLLRLGLNENGHYFNAGVILFDLERIRKDFSTYFLFDIYESNEEKIFLADQDVLNIAFSDKVKCPPDRNHNYMIFSGQKVSRAEYKKIKKEAVIVHYIRHIKPWQHYYTGKAKYLYLKEQFPLYPMETLKTLILGFFYSFKKEKKTLENSQK